MEIRQVSKMSYNRPLSTVFGSGKSEYSGTAFFERDPTLEDLMTLDYRCLRLFFHPPSDKFAISSGWKDPTWKRAGDLQSGIDSDEKSNREKVFGTNIIDIEQKSILKLLVDEVSMHRQRDLAAHPVQNC